MTKSVNIDCPTYGVSETVPIWAARASDGPRTAPVLISRGSDDDDDEEDDDRDKDENEDNESDGYSE
jgi:hypothetical protein